jgi:hypothetical protein
VRLSRRGVVGLLVAEAIVAAIAAATIVDLRAHSREELARGPNMWGFRGPARLKAIGTRVVVVGGSAAYGLGVDYDRSMPYYLGVSLDRRNPSTDVVNLAAPGDGAASYIATLEKYAYLEPQAVCIYDGYSGLGTTGVNGARHASWLFRSVSYFPILDDVIARRQPWDDPAHAAVDPLLRDDAAGGEDVSCAAASRVQCAAIADTVAWAVARHMAVAVVTPPYISRRHEAQQASLTAALTERFRNQARVRVFNMGRTVDVHDRAQSFDGVHLTPLGNQIVGQNLVDPMFQLLRSR